MKNKNLTKIALMQGLNEQEISLILNCLQAKIKKYEKGETIFQEGEKIEEIGIIFSGTVTVQRNDYWGNRSIVALLGELDVFGETFACLNQVSDVQVIAEEASEILFLQVNRVLTTCSSSSSPTRASRPTTPPSPTKSTLTFSASCPALRLWMWAPWRT